MLMRRGSVRGVAVVTCAVLLATAGTDRQQTAGYFLVSPDPPLTSAQLIAVADSATGR